MGQVDFAYGAIADAVGLPLDVSVYADRAAVRVELAEDVAAAGLTLRECGSLEMLATGDLRVLGEAVLIDCPQLDAAGMAALTRLDMRAARSGAMLVVSTSMEALDAVFGCCAQSRPQILVDPRRADRIIALGQVMARAPHGRLHELTETDRMTLLRLTEQVNTIAEKLERLGDAESDAVRAAGMAFRFDEQAGATLRSPGDKLVRPARPPLPDPRLVRRIIQQRQARARFFDGDLFADPAWDMLLDLTAARVEHTRVSVTSLCIASGVPPTTALRWISQMTDAGLLERVEDDTDRRRAFIQLTDKAVDAMARYFAEIGKGGVGMA
ncbi:winged helix DNA-binding protein [Altererythrobacter sp. KTW20L]|uniref:winged helix DNA-binding protein n=1 Tax=Altererythrobacter sp. KTW20L TaxID=2942210 RepID=UPI0020BDF029|nr:winged helix DNA-binding protein [Altererythrobacter sp. KTW20L]MCL6250694.1 winged helix DNA-binding protein [Altererythrobacter sp. KTW20L]